MQKMQWLSSIYNRGEWIQEAELIHGKTLDYSLVKYTTSHAMVKLRCPVHGIFEIAAYQHLQRSHRYSQYCESSSQIRDLESFTVASKAKFGNRFDYSEAIYHGTHSSIVLKCPDHGSFMTASSYHINSSFGCPQCANDEYPSVTIGVEQFVKICVEVHDDKYDYSMLKSECKYRIVAIYGHYRVSRSWTLCGSASNHRYGHGCMKCSKYTDRFDTDRFIESKKYMATNTTIARSYIFRRIKRSASYAPDHGTFEQLFNQSLNQMRVSLRLFDNSQYVDTEIFINEATGLQWKI